MEATLGKDGRIRGEARGAPVRAGDVTVEPAARLVGFVRRQGSGEGEFQYGIFRLKPVSAVVRDAAGTETNVAIVDVNEQAQRGILAAAGAVAGICLLVMGASKLYR